MDPIAWLHILESKPVKLENNRTFIPPSTGIVLCTNIQPLHSPLFLSHFSSLSLNLWPTHTLLRSRIALKHILSKTQTPTYVYYTHMYPLYQCTYLSIMHIHSLIHTQNYFFSLPHNEALNQCDQIGRFIARWATFQSQWQQLFYPNCPHLYEIFWKGVKIFHFSSEIILGHFYRHLATFFWSQWSSQWHSGFSCFGFSPPPPSFPSSSTVFQRSLFCALMTAWLKKRNDLEHSK